MVWQERHMTETSQGEKRDKQHTLVRLGQRLWEKRRIGEL